MYHTIPIMRRAAGYSSDIKYASACTPRCHVAIVRASARSVPMARLTRTRDVLHHHLDQFTSDLARLASDFGHASIRSLDLFYIGRMTWDGYMRLRFTPGRVCHSFPVVDDCMH